MPISIEEAAKEGAQVPLIIGHTNLEGALLARGNKNHLNSKWCWIILTFGRFYRCEWIL